MQSKLLYDNGQKTYALIFDKGDEVISKLTEFAKEHSLKATQFTAIGAFSKATLAFFDWDKKDYKKINVNEQVEVLTLTGDIAIKEGQPTVHAHVILGRSDGSTIGGHLMEAAVRPTLEVILTESPEFLNKKYDQESKLFLIDLKTS
jgi:uncharacterized protein